MFVDSKHMHILLNIFQALLNVKKSADLMTFGR